MRMPIPDITDLSPNFNDTPPTVPCVVIHSTRSGVSMNPSEFAGTLNYMRTPGKTSSQWVISRGGLKARVVHDNKQSWHAGIHNVAFGIELEQGAEADGFTTAQLKSLVEVCLGYKHDFNVPAIRLPDWKFGPGFTGHENTPQGKGSGKSDPGRLFPWEWFMEQMQETPAPVPPIIEEVSMASTDIKWVFSREQPGDFKSYLVWFEGDGPHHRLVRNAEEHAALADTQVAGPLVTVSLQALAGFGISVGK